MLVELTSFVIVLFQLLCLGGLGIVPVQVSERRMTCWRDNYD